MRRSDRRSRHRSPGPTSTTPASLSPRNQATACRTAGVPGGVAGDRGGGGAGVGERGDLDRLLVVAGAAARPRRQPAGRDDRQLAVGDLDVAQPGQHPQPGGEQRRRRRAGAPAAMTHLGEGGVGVGQPRLRPRPRPGRRRARRSAAAASASRAAAAASPGSARSTSAAPSPAKAIARGAGDRWAAPSGEGDQRLRRGSTAPGCGPRPCPGPTAPGPTSRRGPARRSSAGRSRAGCGRRRLASCAWVRKVR